MQLDVEIVAEGLEFPEGPIAMSDGSVLLVEIRGGYLTRVTADGRVERLVHLGGGPNGAAIGPDGAVYVVSNGGFAWERTEVGIIPAGTPDGYAGGSVQRVDLSAGKVTTLYTACDGRPLRGPNDIVFDRAGGFYFTDLAKWNDDVQELGAVFYAAADGSRIKAIRRGLLTPNGIGLSPDGQVLYVAESLTARLWAFDILSPGVVAGSVGQWKPARHVWSAHGLAIYDSLAVEAGGAVCVATVIRGGIDVVSPDDASCDTLPLAAQMVTNLCFGGDDMRTAWITASNTGQLLRCRWPRPGLKPAFNA
ncbi:MAG: SMP-30/gluconolactonase/LRE family protein [Rhizobiaceae bacterium]